MSYVLTWLGLMILLGLTFASSYFPMGPWNTVANTGISCAKALLIATFFMHLRHAGPLLRLAALIGVVWLALLFGLSSADYATRDLSRAPWTSR